MKQSLTAFRISCLFIALAVMVSCASPVPADAPAVHQRGLDLARSGRYDEAIEQFREALALDPSFAPAAISTGYVRILRKQYVEAIPDFDVAIRLDPNLSRAYRGRAIALGESGHPAEAISDYTKAIERSPRSSEAFLGRALAWQQLGQINKAIVDLETIDRIEGVGRMRPTIGRMRFNAGRFSESAEDFRVASEASLARGYTSLWRFLARARSGDDVEAARQELRYHRSLLSGNAWPAAVIDFYLGRSDITALRDAAQHVDVKKAAEQTCEADFYLGQWYILEHEQPASRSLLERASRDCPGDFIERDGAVAELARMPR